MSLSELEWTLMGITLSICEYNFNTNMIQSSNKNQSFTTCTNGAALCGYLLPPAIKMIISALSPFSERELTL